ncbi:MAG: PKD domain-containing protein, partial [Spirosomataceae bacterium]
MIQTLPKFFKRLNRLISVCNLTFTFLIVSFASINANAQADCSSAIIVCGNTQAYNPSGVGEKLERLACGGDVGGGIEHNSLWFAFQAKANGTLNFVIRPTTLQGLPTVVDVDWSLYQLAGAPGTSNCNNKTQLSCNFAGSSTVFGIPGATGMATPPFTAAQFNPGIDVVAGTWYAIHIDQFSNTTPILLNVQFTGNPESTNLNSTSGIFDNRPNFTSTLTSGCSGTYNFNSSSSTATSGIASYLWDFGDGSTATTANPSHSYVTTGTYFVNLTVTDNNGCKATIRKKIIYNITPPTVNAASIFVTSACSNSNNGEITVVDEGTTTLGVTGGTAPYTYELVSPSPMIRAAQSSNKFTGLQPGGYFIKVTDACGRSAVSTVVTVSQVATNTTIGLGIQNIQSACLGSPTGTATIFANGTAPPYTMALVTSSPVTIGASPSFMRDPITATFYTTFENLLPGLYTVEAVDGCGKTRRATFTVIVSTAPTANAVASPSCVGSATGTVTVTATAATGLSANGSPGTFQYALISPSPILRSFQNSSVFENLLPGNYTVAVRDNCSNIGTTTVTVGTAVAPNFGTSFTSASCPNGSTGTIEVQNGTTAGGGSPYTYALIAPSPVTRPSQNDNAFTNLPPGTYTVRMTDVCGTSARTTVSVAASSAPTFTTAVGASCTNPAAGTITVTPGASSIGAYTFELISPGGAIRATQGSNVANTNNSIFTNLSQGSYTVRMTDGCGVPVTGTATVSSPTALVFPTGSAAVASCSTPGSGQITVAQPTTGLAPYTYELIAPSFVTRSSQNSRIFNNLPSGNYIVRITDFCGTQVDNSATPINVPVSTAPTLTVTNSASCATASGTITCVAATANQGGGTYQFSLIAPSPVTRPNQTSPIFTGLPAGAYTVQITDQCGQTGTNTTTIAPAGAFTPAAGGSIARCDGGSGYIGQLIVTTPQNFTPGGPIPVGSGGGPYTYALYDATNTTLIAGPQASNVFSNITPVAGSPSHTIRVTDVCGNTSTTTGTINNPTAITTATISATTASCSSSNTGVIKVTVQSGGGLPPLRYSLIDAVTSAVVMAPQTSTTFTNVPDNATGYLVRTTDACGNVATSTMPLLFPAAVAPTATVVTTPSCVSSSTGRIVVTPDAGATLAGGTFSYALYDAANTVLVRSSQASPVFSSLATGTYTVRITNQCGAVGTVAAVIDNTVPALTATGSITGTCSGGSSGVIAASASGGSLPRTFSLVLQSSGSVIAGPQADSVFAGLAANTYIVRVTDACGTISNSSNLVLGNLSVSPLVSTTTALDCDGGSVISGYGGGGSGGPYTYAICSGSACSSFGSFSTTSTFTIASSGTYRIAVRDQCGSQTASGNIVVTIPTKATITGITKANTCGATTITVAFTNVPNTPYYSLDGGNFTTTIGSVPVGNHTIRVSNFNAGTFECASNPFAFTVNATPSAPNTTTNVSVCSGSSASLTATCTVGTVTWYDSNTNQLATTSPYTTPTLTSPTTYNVRCENSGCNSGFVAVNITINPGPSASISYAGGSFCRTASPVNVNLTGSSGGTFSSSPAGLSLSPTTGQITPSSSTVGTYTVTYTIAASGGCAAFTATTSVTITNNPTATISYAGSPFCRTASPVSVNLTGSSGGAFSSSPAGLSISNTTGQITPSSSTAGTYTVSYTIAASGGCSGVTATTSVTITNAPSATISYAGSSFCRTASPVSVNLTGSSGGAFSSSPAGLSISNTTGQITPSSSTAGTYTVSYTIAASGG